MSTFIARQIMKAADISLEVGKEKYRVYFVNTQLYASYKADTDTILETTTGVKYPNGYREVIVSK